MVSATTWSISYTRGSLATCRLQVLRPRAMNTLKGECDDPCVPRFTLLFGRHAFSPLFAGFSVIGPLPCGRGWPDGAGKQFLAFVSSASRE